MDKSTRLDGRSASGQRVLHPASKVIQRAKFRSGVVRKSLQPKPGEEGAIRACHCLEGQDALPTRIAASARHSCGPLRRAHASLRALKQAKIRWPEGSDRLYYLHNNATSSHSPVYHTITARNHGLKEDAVNFFHKTTAEFACNADFELRSNALPIASASVCTA